MPPSDGTAAIDLTGAWHGQYSRPNAVNAPVAFEASLICTEEFLGGTITERAAVGRLKGRVLCASVSGARTGRSVSFVKTYEPGCEPYTSVDYEGVVSGDGLEISGDWKIGRYCGRFLMIRAGGVAQAEGRRIHEKLPST
jgi:hypothetical protein